MFDIGFPELVMIMVIALLVFGPGKMAQIGRDLGKGLRDFRRATSDVTREFNDALKLDEPDKPAPAPAPAPVPAPVAALESAQPPAVLQKEEPQAEGSVAVVGSAEGAVTSPPAPDAAAADASATDVTQPEVVETVTEAAAAAVPEDVPSITTEATPLVLAEADAPPVAAEAPQPVDIADVSSAS